MVTNSIYNEFSSFQIRDRIGEMLERYQVFVNKAESHHNIEEKKAFYNSAYQAIVDCAISFNGTLPYEVNKSFFTLLELYAAKICYAQVTPNGDKEGGFKKSAQLMELSFSLQLANLGVIDFSYNWKMCRNLEDLIDHSPDLFLEIAEYPHKFMPEYLVAKAKDGYLMEIMAKTLIRMTYSHQNIFPIKNDLEAFHLYYNELTEKLIGINNEEQKKELIQYKYNRCRFLASKVSNGDFENQFKSYDSVIEKIDELFKEKTFFSESIYAQIENMRGLILMKLSLLTPNHQSDIHKNAYLLFQRAFHRRSALLKICDDKERSNQEYFLSNIRTALMAILNSRNPKSEEDINQLLEHAFALRQYVDKLKSENNSHFYLSKYETALQQVDNIFK